MLGQTAKPAVSTLKKAGFVASITEQETEDLDQEGRVISQFPPGGSRGQRGDSVSITVGTAPPPERARRPRMKVAVLRGGRSSEHDVSLRSGAAVADGLREAGHEVVEVLIERDGRWLDGGGRGLDLTPGGRPARLRRRLPGPARARAARTAASRALLEVADIPYVGSDVESSALCLDKLAFKRAARVLRDSPGRLLPRRASRAGRREAEALGPAACG